MSDPKFISAMPQIFIGIVIDENKTNNEINFVHQEEYKTNDISLGDIRSAKIVGSSEPFRKKSQCLILQTASEEKATYFCLGVLENNQTIDEIKQPKANLKTNPTNSPAAKRIDGMIVLENTSSKLSFDDTIFNLQMKDASLVMMTGSFSLIGQSMESSFGIIAGKDKLLLQHHKGITNQSANEVHRIYKGGNFIVTGGILDKEESVNDQDNYNAIGEFFVKAKNVTMDANGGIFNLSGNVYNIFLGSSLLAGSIPGTGPINALNVEIIQGNSQFTTGIGSFYIDLQNISFLDEIQLKCGSLIHPTNSTLTMDAFSNKLCLQTAFMIIESYLEFSTGGFSELYSFLDIDIKSMVGKISMSALQDISMDTIMNIKTSSLLKTQIDSIAGTDITSLGPIKIDGMTTVDLKALVKATVEATITNVIGTAMLKLESALIDIAASAMLDFSKSTMIQFGPKMAAPPGVAGPLCALPMCLFTGAPHVATACV